MPAKTKIFILRLKQHSLDKEVASFQCLIKVHPVKKGKRKQQQNHKVAKSVFIRDSFVEVDKVSAKYDKSVTKIQITFSTAELQ